MLRKPRKINRDPQHRRRYQHEKRKTVEHPAKTQKFPDSHRESCYFLFYLSTVSIDRPVQLRNREIGQYIWERNSGSTKNQESQREQHRKISSETYSWVVQWTSGGLVSWVAKVWSLSLKISFEKCFWNWSNTIRKTEFKSQRHLPEAPSEKPEL